MTEKVSKTVRFYYGWTFGAYTIVVGALFIWQTLSVYLTGTAPDYTGEAPFTYERVAAALYKISVPFYLWIALIVVGFVLWEIFPAKEQRLRLPPDYALMRMKKKLPENVPVELQDKMNYIRAQEKAVKTLKLCAFALCCAASVYGLVYFCIPANFPRVDATAEMLQMAKHVFPCVFAAFIICCVVTLYESRSAKLQTPAVKEILAATKGQPVRLADRTAYSRAVAALSSERSVWIARGVLVILAITLIIVGVFNGSMHDVLAKAINICTECIGLG